MTDAQGFFLVCRACFEALQHGQVAGVHEDCDDGKCDCCHPDHSDGTEGTS